MDNNHPGLFKILNCFVSLPKERLIGRENMYHFDMSYFPLDVNMVIHWFEYRRLARVIEH